MRPKTSPVSTSSNKNSELLSNKVKITKGEKLRELANYLSKKFPQSSKDSLKFSPLQIIRLSDVYLLPNGQYNYEKLDIDIEDKIIFPLKKEDLYEKDERYEEISLDSKSNPGKSNSSKENEIREILMKELYTYRVLLSSINEEMQLNIFSTSDSELKELNKFFKIKSYNYLTSTYGNKLTFKQLKFVLLNKIFYYNKNYLLNNQNLEKLFEFYDKNNTGIISLRVLVDNMFKFFPFPLNSSLNSSNNVNNSNSFSLISSINSSNAQNLKNLSQNINSFLPNENNNVSFSINNLGIDSTSSFLPSNILEFNNNNKIISNNAPFQLFTTGSGQSALNSTSKAGEVRPMRLTDDLVSDIDDSNCPNFTIEELEEIIYRKIQDYFLKLNSNKNKSDRLSSKDLINLISKISNKNEFVLDSHCFRALLQRLNVPFRHAHISMLINKYEEDGASSGSAAKKASSCIVRPSSASHLGRKSLNEKSTSSFSSSKNINNVILKNFYNDSEAIPLPSTSSSANISSFSSSSDLKLFKTLNFDKKINILKLCNGLIKRIDKIDYYFYNNKEGEPNLEYEIEGNDNPEVNDDEYRRRESCLKENIFSKLKINKIVIKKEYKLILKKFFILLKNKIKQLLYREKSCENNLLLNSNNFLLYLMTEIRMKKFFKYRLHINLEEFSPQVLETIRFSFGQNGLFDIRKIFLYAMTVIYSDISDEREEEEVTKFNDENFYTEEKKFYQDISPTVLLVNNSYQNQNLAKSFISSTFSSSNKAISNKESKNNNGHISIGNCEGNNKINDIFAHTVRFNETPQIFSDPNVNASSSLKNLGLKINSSKNNKKNNSSTNEKTKTPSISDIYKSSTPFLSASSGPTIVDITFGSKSPVHPSTASSVCSNISRTHSASGSRQSFASDIRPSTAFNVRNISRDICPSSPCTRRPTSAPSLRSNRNLIAPESQLEKNNIKEKKKNSNVSSSATSFNYVDPMSPVLRDRYKLSLNHSPTSHAAYGIHIKDYEKAKKDRKRLHQKLIKKNKIKNLYYSEDEFDDY